MLNKDQIKNIIPQREPFLMIDEVENYVPGESAIAYKYLKDIFQVTLLCQGFW